MKRSITYKDKKISLIEEVPDSVYQKILREFPPDSANPSSDIIAALTYLLANKRMAFVWPKLEKASTERQKEYPDTSVESLLNYTFSLFLHLYRKNKATQPISKIGKKSFQDSKYRDSMRSHTKKLLKLFNEYPHSYEFHMKNDGFSKLSYTLSSLLKSLDTFKPEGPSRNAMFTDAPNSRKSKGIEGRQTYFIEQSSEGLQKAFGKPLHEIVAEVASLLFPDTKSAISAEDVRQRTSVKKKVQKRKKRI